MNNDIKYNDLIDAITDIREYDIPYHIRVCIDNDIRISYWYQINFQDNFISEIKCLKDMAAKADLRILGIS